MAATDFVTESQVDSLTSTIAAAVKANKDNIGSGSLNTTAQTIIAAINEVLSGAETAGAAASVQSNLDDHESEVSGAHAASAISFADVAGDYTATDVEAALAEVRVVADAAAGGGVAINDGLTNTTDAWSSQKISDEITTAINNLVDGAPAALDTLNELAAAIGDNATFEATVTTALGNRLRIDAAQGLTAPQQDQGKANLGIASSTQDFAGDFNTGIA